MSTSLPRHRCEASIAQKIGVVETASDFLKRRAGKARPNDMLAFLDRAKRETPPVGDEL